MLNFFETHPKVKNISIIFIDLFLILASSILSILIVTETIPSFLNLAIFTGISIILEYLLFFIFRLNNTSLRYFGFIESIKLITSIVFTMIVNLIILTFFRNLPLRWAIVFTLLQSFFLLTFRYSYRLFSFIQHKISIRHSLFKNVMVIGAGDTGRMIVQEMLNNNKLGLNPVCIIDDDPLKQNLTIDGIKVVGNRDKIVESAKKYHVDLIVVAIVATSKAEISKILMICQDTLCHVQIIPSISNMLTNPTSITNLRDVDVNDLLGRDPIIVNSDEIKANIEGKKVLVTGGGGSIGSELCRQIAKMNPEMLIIFDIYENNAYDIEQELKKNYPNLNLKVLIGSVRNNKTVDKVFKTYQPDIVFHAAAHKHVPLMETCPNEAVKNNVFGTLNVARASDKYNAKRFVLISTDKAVRPTNVMGATKRICEMIIQLMARHSTCLFSAVRFGNVLGSNGSVIPLFKKQIASGGPVTVTHKDIIRYFMTIPEAVSLVLQASTFALGGEIFILDMGQPVKIYDLAVNLIKLSGLRPDIDIKIVTTGLRPGEKLYEELLLAEEGIKETKNKLIFVAKPISFDEDNFFSSLDNLYKLADDETDNIKDFIKSIVTNYKDEQQVQ